MANDGTGTGWDEASPGDSSVVPLTPQEIRDIRKGLRLRVSKEHITPAAASVGGEHTAGSAKAFYTAVTPTTRPDGVTALDNVATPTGDKGRMWVNGTTLAVWTGTTWATINASSSGVAIAHLYDTKATGLNGGSFASGSYLTRTLQTEDDPNGIVTLSANRFTLAAGTYYIRSIAPAFKVNGHKTRLQNITDATTSAIGSSEFSGSGGDYAQTESKIETIVTIAGAKAFEIQHRCETTNADTKSWGRACPSSFAINEVYTQVMIVKMA